MANITKKALSRMQAWRDDWNLFAREVLRANLDSEQQAILRSVQSNRMTAVASGTARGKDYVAACCALCFMYLTPAFGADGKLKRNTKIAMTAPTGRQVANIMTPEVRRLFRNAGILPGRLVANDIRTDYDEWFLTGFKADDNNTEAWSGFHAVNTMFIITEASGVSESIFNAIEGNLQGNSRILIVFNPNTTSGYAARAMTSPRWAHFRLNSLNAENVVKKKVVINGQVDYDWVKDKVESWCTRIAISEMVADNGDFEWEGACYRPNDLFRIKVLGMFPKVSEDVLVPYEWIESANRRWMEMQEQGAYLHCGIPLTLGVDVAGMGRDCSVWCHRYGSYVEQFVIHHSLGKADHMHVAGETASLLNNKEREAYAFIDTIGEGAGVFSRLQELGYKNALSCKFSESARYLTDTTGQHHFANMRAYLYWCVRDWLNPANKQSPALPPNDRFAQEITDTHWRFQSNGSIIIEPKDNIKSRLNRSPDLLDALANTFYPYHNNKQAMADLYEDIL